MNDEEVIDENDVTPTPEPDAELESTDSAPAMQDDVETVDEADVETVDEGDIQALPEAAAPIPGRPMMPASEALPLLAAQGATLGFRDELAGGIMGAVEGVKALPQGPGAALMAAREKYRQVSEAERLKTKMAREDYPVAGTAAEMAGGFATPVAGARAFGSGIRGAIGAGGVFGGISGAGEADPGERLGGAGIGVLTGGAFGGTMAAVPRALTSGAVATGAKALAPGLDAPFYAEMLQDPVLRRRALEARRNNPDPAAAGEQVGGLFGDVVQGVRQKAVASKEAGNRELIQAGYLAKPMDDAVRHVEQQIAFVERPENAHNYTPKFRETLYRAYQNLKGFFPEANAAQGEIARLDGMQQKAAKTALDLQAAQASSNKSALMAQRVARLQNELRTLNGQIAPLKDRVDGILIKGYHEARQDLDSVINWKPMSDIPRPSRADQEKAIELRQYIDGILKSQPTWRAHDELYAAWAPLESALKKNIIDNGGNGNVSYKKVWSL